MLFQFISGRKSLRSTGMGPGEVPLSRKHPTGSKIGTPGKKQQPTELVETLPLETIETVWDRSFWKAGRLNSFQSWAFCLSSLIMDFLGANYFSLQVGHPFQQPNTPTQPSRHLFGFVTTVSFRISLDFTCAQELGSSRPSCRHVDFSKKAETIMCWTLVGQNISLRAEENDQEFRIVEK